MKTDERIDWLVQEIDRDIAGINVENGGRYTGQLYNRWMLNVLRMLKDVVERHRDWPILVDTEPSFTVHLEDNPSTDEIVAQMSKQISWMTEREYIAVFGTLPPTQPMIERMLDMYQFRPGFKKEWLPNGPLREA